MANPFRKLPPHSSINAFSITAYNAMIDLLNEHRMGGRIGGSPQRNLVDWDQTVFRVRNDTGRDLWSYDIVGLDGPIWSPADGEDELQEFRSQTSQKGVSPTVEAHLGKWGVMLEATENGSVGRCCMSGVVPVRVYVTSQSDQYCDVIAAQTVEGETCYLGTGASGVQILWLDPTASVGSIAWAIIRFGGSGTGVPPYNSYFKLVDTSETVGETTTLYISIVDGATWDADAETSGDSVARVNNVTYNVDKWESSALTSTKMFYLHWTAPVGETPASMEIVAGTSLPSDTASDLYYLLGRAIITDGAMTIVQEHDDGVAILWWFLTCGEAQE